MHHRTTSKVFENTGSVAAHLLVSHPWGLQDFTASDVLQHARLSVAPSAVHTQLALQSLWPPDASGTDSEAKSLTAR